MTGLTLKPGQLLLAKDSQGLVDLAAISGGEPEVMFRAAIDAMGGMKRFVKGNQKVLVKPNIGWDAPPERAANTHPSLVMEIIKSCYEAGAKEVFVFDNPCDEWTRSYKNSGIEAAAKEAGATVVSGKNESYYHEVELPRAKSLKKAKVHELVLNSDVFINVPILKNHRFGGQITIAMKNLMGVVWDRDYWHANDLHQCIADFADHFKPHLNIVDAYRIIRTNGPQGISVNDTALMKAQLISPDIVSVDTAATKLFGLDPASVSYITKGHSNKTGTMDLDSINIKRMKL